MAGRLQSEQVADINRNARPTSSESATKGLIERHGGNFSMKSMPNYGITVRLSFPAERILSGSNAPSHNSVDVRP